MEENKEKREFRIIGLRTEEEMVSRDHGNRVSEGMKEGRKKRASAAERHRRLRERVESKGIPWTEHQWGSERLKFKHSQQKYKRLYRKKLELEAYRLWGVVRPGKKTGPKPRADIEDWELKMNFISQGWDPLGGPRQEERPEICKDRWDLDESEWMKFWGNFPESLRSDYRLMRKDTSKSFHVDNMMVAKRLGK